jgi:hypothetical protein
MSRLHRYGTRFRAQQTQPFIDGSEAYVAHFQLIHSHVRLVLKYAREFWFCIFELPVLVIVHPPGTPALEL